MNRRSDIYVFSSSFTHSVVPKDKWLAFVSTTVETSNPEAELAPGEAQGRPVATQNHHTAKMHMMCSALIAAKEYIRG